MDNYKVSEHEDSKIRIDCTYGFATIQPTIVTSEMAYCSESDSFKV